MTTDSRSLKFHVLLATCLGGYCDGLDASLYTIALYPAISELLRTSSHAVVGVYGSFALAAFLFGWAIGSIIFGILSDYFGRVRIMLITILLYALCTGLCATAHNWQELAVYRFLVGCGVGGEMSAGIVLISEYFRGNSRIYFMSLMCVAITAGHLSTGLLNLLLGHYGWRPLFVAGILPALLTFYVRAKLTELPQAKIIQEKNRKQIASKNGKEKATQMEDAPWYLKLNFFSLFSSAQILQTMVITIIASATIVQQWAVMAWVPAWINALVGTAAVSERSCAVSAMWFGGMLSGASGSLFISRLGRANTLRLSFFGALFTSAIMFLSVTTYSLIVPGFCLVEGFFNGLAFFTLFVYVPELLTSEVRGVGFGFSVQIGRMFAALAALGGGQLIMFFGGSYALACVAISACINSLGLIASFLLPKVELGRLIDESALTPTETQAVSFER